MKRHLLSMNDLDRQDILTILDTAETMHDVAPTHRRNNPIRLNLPQKQ